MNQDAHFWLNWAVQLLGVVGTLLVAVIALFGEAIRGKLLPPRLSLALRSKVGEKGQFRYPTNGAAHEGVINARYYHVTVSNARRWSQAKETQVFLTLLEEECIGGGARVVWVGQIPMSWRHREISPLVRTIGADADCDLCCADQNGRLQLMPLIIPLNLKHTWEGRFVLWLTLQAKSHLADSPPLRLKISWDGEWHDGDLEMSERLKIVEDSGRPAQGI